MGLVKAQIQRAVATAEVAGSSPHILASMTHGAGVMDESGNRNGIKQTVRRC